MQLTISINSNDRDDMIMAVARVKSLLEEGYVSGIDPTWNTDCHFDDVLPQPGCPARDSKDRPCLKSATHTNDPDDKTHVSGYENWTDDDLVRCTAVSGRNAPPEGRRCTIETEDGNHDGAHVWETEPNR